MKFFIQGPPPWKDDHLYHIVNTHHLKAAKKFRKMTKEERKLEAIKKLSDLDKEDNFTILNERLDNVLLTGLKASMTSVVELEGA